MMFGICSGAVAYRVNIGCMYVRQVLMVWVHGAAASHSGASAGSASRGAVSNLGTCS
jgi:hypothetical protein